MPAVLAQVHFEELQQHGDFAGPSVVSVWQNRTYHRCLLLGSEGVRSRTLNHVSVDDIIGHFARGLLGAHDTRESGTCVRHAIDHVVGDCRNLYQNLLEMGSLVKTLRAHSLVTKSLFARFASSAVLSWAQLQGLRLFQWKAAVWLSAFDLSLLQKRRTKL